MTEAELLRDGDVELVKLVFPLPHVPKMPMVIGVSACWITLTSDFR